MQNSHRILTGSRHCGILPPSHLHVKSYLIAAILLLLLSFVGVILTNWQSQYAYGYWNGLVIVFALSSLGLSFFSSFHDEDITPVDIWREALHWLGLFAAVYLVSRLEAMGFFSAPIASLVVLQLLALATFLAGVHFDSMYLFIGVFLGLIVLLSVLMIKYLTFIVLPILILFIAGIWYLHYKSTHKKRPDIEPF